MMAVVQRARRASVAVGGEEVARIGRGFLVLLGVAIEDTEEDAERLARKTAFLRIFEDEGGKMNLSLKDVGGEALVVSQFTLLADTRKGRRPAFTRAAPPEAAEPLYVRFAESLEGEGIRVKRGVFGAKMAVSLLNWGPVTLLLSSRG